MHFAVRVPISSAVRPWIRALESVMSEAERGVSPFWAVMVGGREGRGAWWGGLMLWWAYLIGSGWWSGGAFLGQQAHRIWTIWHVDCF